MWIVRLALRRPYTFVVAAILISILGGFCIHVMPTDIFPNVDIPVISVIYNYQGMSSDDMANRIISPYERILTTTVNDIEHIESQSLNGIGVVKIFFQPNAQIAAANAQVTAISQTAIRQMPTGTQPPLVIQYSASNVPIIQLSLSSETMSEQEMFDVAVNLLRPKLVTIPGIQIPYPYGGKQRQIVVDLDPQKLYAFGISPADVSTAVNNQNLILPAGSVKIGPQEYQVRINSSPQTVPALNALPIKSVTNSDGTRTTIFIRDVAHVRDGFQVQTNVVHSNAKRGVLISILKNGNASTLAVVDGVKAMLPELYSILPPTAQDLKITPIFDQSVFVRASVSGVVKEAAIAAGLTALMILLFLGSWRSTLIVVISIPLSILVSIIVLAAMGYTLNVMTLGGMALAVGILVDDATVEIENIHRNLHQRKRLVQAILDGASQIAVPAFVSTLCICIVFVPVAFISGAAKFLFTPLALAVAFAMMTSYLLSRTLVPTMVHYLLASEVKMYGGEIDPDDVHAHAHDRDTPEQVAWRRSRNSWIKFLLLVVASTAAVAIGVLAIPAVGQHVPAAHKTIITNWQTIVSSVLVGIGFIAAVAVSAKYNLIWRIHFVFNAQFEKLRHFYGRLLAWALHHRAATVTGFAVMICSSLILFFFEGQDFFPGVDAGQIRLHVRAPAGTRIEQTERYFDAVQQIIHEIIPPSEIAVVLDNMGIPNSGINLSLSDGSINSPADGEVLVSLNETHGPTEKYIKQIREKVHDRLPELVVWSAPSDIATQVLNFGLPASIDVQLTGPPRTAIANRKAAEEMAYDLASIPGIVDQRIQQVTSTPDLRVDVDRTLASEVGVTQREVASDLLISLSSSNQTAPNFWLNPVNNVNYSIFVQTPQYRIQTLQDLSNQPVTPANATSSDQSQLLGNLASVSRGTSATSITHYNIDPTSDVLLGVQDADLGSVKKAVEKVTERYRQEKKIPAETKIALRGQVESMANSFLGLSIGLLFAVTLVYLLMVINFQSWLDPLIILMALPGAAAGILWMLWGTQTTISVPALMGTMMCVGVATANSILMITFANDQRKDHGMNAHDAALAAGLTRLRPVIMTALAMIIGMLPMSLGLGEGGEQNAPLGRAVIGGLMMATISTLLFVPVVYSLLRHKSIVTTVEEELR